MDESASRVGSGEGVEDVEEEDAEEPDGDEDVVDGEGDVLVVLLDLDDQRHAVHDEDADEGEPRHDCMVDSVVEEADAEQGCVRREVPAMP